MPKRKSAQTTSIDKSPLQLCCLIKGQGSVFTVPVATDKNTFDLKKLVYEEGKKTLGNVDVTSLVFLKVSEHSAPSPAATYFLSIVRLISLSLVSLEMLSDNLEQLKTTKGFKS